MQTPSSREAITYFDTHRDEFLDDLRALVRIPSVSFTGFDPAHVRAAADAVAAMLVRCGMENVRLLETGGHPAVYGEWMQAAEKPTVLLYAHHDVQPPGREELWETPPFEPSVRDGRLYGRGTADDKAGVMAHVAAVASYLGSTGSLPVNIKVLIEGEEEAGSVNLSQILEEHHAMLSADALILTDTGNLDTGIPAITVGLRGLVTVKVEVRALRHSVHSGSWGGPLPDPALALSKMLASLVDQEGRIAIPGIMDRVRPLTQSELAGIEALPYDEQEFRRQSGLIEQADIVGGDASTYAKMWYLPSVAVNAIEVSSRKQAANIINDVAWARAGIRIVADMDPQETLDLLSDHLRTHAPWGVEVTIEPEPIGGWWRADGESTALKAAKTALEKGYGRRPFLIGTGGSIPFVGTLTERLGGISALLIGIEDPYSRPHSENESLHIEDWGKACRSLIYLYEELARGID